MEKRGPILGVGVRVGLVVNGLEGKHGDEKEEQKLECGRDSIAAEQREIEEVWRKKSVKASHYMLNLKC